MKKIGTLVLVIILLVSASVIVWAEPLPNLIAYIENMLYMQTTLEHEFPDSTGVSFLMENETMSVYGFGSSSVTTKKGSTESEKINILVSGMDAEKKVGLITAFIFATQFPSVTMLKISAISQEEHDKFSKALMTLSTGSNARLNDIQYSIVKDSKDNVYVSATNAN